MWYLKPYLKSLPDPPPVVKKRTLIVEDLVSRLDQANSVDEQALLLSSLYLVLPEISADEPDWLSAFDRISVSPKRQDVVYLLDVVAQALPATLIRIAGTGEGVPVVFDPSGFLIVLARLGGSDGRVTAVSDSGVMVGWSETAGGQTRAARWTQGVVIDLGSLANSDSVARAVNSIGQVAGEGVDGIGQTRAFLFHIGQMKALALPVGATGNSAYGLSDSGVVVGSAVVGGTEAAYAWYPGNQVVDLNALSVLPAGFSLSRAVGIDDGARIAAIGFNAGTGETRGFLLTPVF